MIIKKQAILEGYIFKRITWKIGDGMICNRCNNYKKINAASRNICRLCHRLCIKIRKIAKQKSTIYWNYIYEKKR